LPNGRKDGQLLEYDRWLARTGLDRSIGARGSAKQPNQGGGLRKCRGSHGRGVLDRVGAAHREQALALPAPGQPLKANTRPYTDADVDVDTLIRWANGQRSDLKRHALLAVISAGLGAGLTTADLLTVHGPDIRTHPDGTVTVDVHGGKPRTVTVLRRYEHLLAGLATHVGDGWIVAPGPPPTSATGLARQWERAQPNPAGPDLTLRRCAVTWQRDHLRLGTRLDVLAAAAGIGPRALADQRVPQLAPEPDSQATTRLRAAAHPPEPHQPRPRLPAAYTRNEIDALLAWATAQPNTQTRDYLLAILAVGLGTGLRAADHPTTRGTDTATDPASGALLLTVRGTAPRIVPCLREHEDLLHAAAHLAGDHPVVQGPTPGVRPGPAPPTASCRPSTPTSNTKESSAVNGPNATA